MMPFLFLLAGILLGGVAGWLAGSLRAQRVAEEARIGRAEAEGRAREMEKNLESQRALLGEAEARWKDAFENLSAKALAQLQAGARGDLGERQKAIETMLVPLQESLRSYQQRLQQSESAQTQTLGQVKAQIESLLQQSQSLSTETGQLRRVLSSGQARGKWGEDTLRRVVEAAGMSAHCDFTEQTMQGDGKPDLVVRLPGNRVIVVDAKVPDLDFLAALDTADEAKRRDALTAHATKLKQTIKALADRDYPSQFKNENALDSVILFLPAESLFSAALEGDRDLIVWAAERSILLATPASFIALLKAVALSWQQHVATENAQKMVGAAAELYERVSKFVEHVARVGDALGKATNAFNDAAGTFERRVIPSAERLKKLGAVSEETEVPSLRVIEQQPRALGNGERGTRSEERVDG